MGRIVRFVREVEHIGPGSMDWLMGAGSVDRETRLGRAVLVELNGAARRWTERVDNQGIRAGKRKASVLHSTPVPDGQESLH